MRTNKYGNKKVEIDGYTFDSQAEARRYQELKLLEKAGEINHLKLQPKYDLIGDKSYVRTVWDRVVEDVKSPATAKDKTYIVKRNLFEYQNPDIEFREVI